MQALIVNTVVLNGGDAAILQATMGLLRSALGADTRFVIHESQARTAARYYPELTMRRRSYLVAAGVERAEGARARLLRGARLARFRLACEVRARGLGAAADRMTGEEARRVQRDFTESDLVVTTGGTYLVEHYDFTSRLFALEVARRLRKPRIFFTQSLGPFTRPETRRAVSREVEGAALVLLRDERSLDHLRDLGIRTDHLHVTADSVFAMADEPAIRAAAQAGVFSGERHADGRPRVAVSVREWSHFRNSSPEAGMAAYRAAMVAILTRLVERFGTRITFLSTCQGVPEYWTDDSKVAREIVALLPPHVRDACEVNDEFHRPEDLATRLRSFDLVVTTRMHMAILALGVGTLVLPISYEFKTRELFTRLGLAEFVHDMEGLQADALRSTLDRFLEEAADVRATMFAGVERERRRALEGASLVRAAVGGMASAGVRA